MAYDLPGDGLQTSSSVRGRAQRKSGSQHLLCILRKVPPSTWRPGHRASQGALRMGKGLRLSLAQDRGCQEGSCNDGNPKVFLL